MLALLVVVAAAAAAPLPPQAARCEQILRENIVPFWRDKAIDRANGGYQIAFGPAGEVKPPAEKMIVTQARTLWLFARLARAGYGKEHLRHAEHGFRFLRDRMWDAKHGGF